MEIIRLKAESSEVANIRWTKKFTQSFPDDLVDNSNELIGQPNRITLKLIKKQTHKAACSLRGRKERNFSL